MLQPSHYSNPRESFNRRSANTESNARLDIHSRGFWNTGQGEFFDVRVFHTNASSNCSMTTTAAYRKHELAKKQEYSQCVCDVKYGVFTPLILTTIDGMGHEATTFYKRLADAISRKTDKSYSHSLFSAFVEADRTITTLSVSPMWPLQCWRVPIGLKLTVIF